MLLRRPDDMLDLPEKSALEPSDIDRLHAIVRAAAKQVLKRNPTARPSRLEICKRLVAGDNAEVAGTEMATLLRTGTKSERHYLISGLYVLLMPQQRRRRLSAFFTPPALCEHVVRRVIELGYDPTTDAVLDPACGGAAFLVPLAQRAFAGSLGQIEPERLRSLVAGIELEPGLAHLSELLVADVLGLADSELNIVHRGNALKADLGDRTFGLVLSNPPYGRVLRPSGRTISRWHDVIALGHVNSYALFIALAIERARSNGLIAIVVPTSFMAGPYFANLRRHIRETTYVLGVDLIEKRSDAFMDVVQDTCILYLRKAAVSEAAAPAPTCAAVGSDGTSRSIGNIQLPMERSGEWVLPTPDTLDLDFFDAGFETLEDYGYQVRTGYFVWNRSKYTDRSAPATGEVPLIWAHNVAANDRVYPSARSSAKLTSFVAMDPSSRALIRAPSIVLQRTTNRRQSRRLIAAYVSRATISQFGGFVTENHTIVVTPKDGHRPIVPLSKLLLLLNSKPVDDMFRRVSGTVSVSTQVLRRLPLPKAHVIRDATLTDNWDETALAAYLKSATIKSQAR